MNLHDKKEMIIFKSYGINNIGIIKTFNFAIIFGIFISTVFYTASSSLKHIYLGFKNKYTNDNKYLAIVKNGLWIKDNGNNVTSIINAETYSNYNLKGISITSRMMNLNYYTLYLRIRLLLAMNFGYLKVLKNLNQINK